MFCLSLRALIGPKGLSGEESFDFERCSPAWLFAEVERENLVSGRFHLFMVDFDYGTVERYVAKRIAQATGTDWRDRPERYGLCTTCYNRFVRWRKAGVWDRLMEAITAAHDGDIQMIDSASVCAHRQAATVWKGVQIITAGQIVDTLPDHPGRRTIVLADRA